VLRRKIKGMLYCSRNLSSRSSSSSRRKSRRKRRGTDAESRSRIRNKSIVAAEAAVSERKSGRNVCDSDSSFSDCREVIIKQRWGLTLYISILLSCEVRNRTYSILG
jgi:hypothetical protein